MVRVTGMEDVPSLQTCHVNRIGDTGTLVSFCPGLIHQNRIESERDGDRGGPYPGRRSTCRQA